MSSSAMTVARATTRRARVTVDVEVVRADGLRGHSTAGAGVVVGQRRAPVPRRRLRPGESAAAASETISRSARRRGASRSSVRRSPRGTRTNAPDLADESVIVRRGGFRHGEQLSNAHVRRASVHMHTRLERASYRRPYRPRVQTSVKACTQPFRPPLRPKRRATSPASRRVRPFRRDVIWRCRSRQLLPSSPDRGRLNRGRADLHHEPGARVRHRRCIGVRPWTEDQRDGYSVRERCARRACEKRGREDREREREEGDGRRASDDGEPVQRGGVHASSTGTRDAGSGDRLELSTSDGLVRAEIR